LANTAWAFATLGYDKQPLPSVSAEEVLKQIREGVSASTDDACLEDFITNLKALAWAAHFAGWLTEDLDVDIHDSLLGLAAKRDLRLAAHVERCPPPPPTALPPRHVFVTEGADPDLPPEVLLDLPELCVVHKPPGWEVDCADVGTGMLLSTYLQQKFSPREAPLVHYEEHQFGMVHRLDRVSSGLLLIGKTFVGFHSLNWQLNTGRLEREYVVVVHGWLSLALRFIDAKVLHVHAEGHKESRVTEQGKPAQTRLTTLGHYTLRGHEEEKLSIVAIQICTGRRHQIRAHLKHVGHPTVADGKYMPREQFIRDKQWCERNFLHRYRLGFSDANGNKHEATAVLPHDLLTALAHLAPACPASDEALQEWASCQPPKAWCFYQGLAA